MTNFRTIMVSDGNAALSQELHDASLTAFYLTFGDVMDTDMIIASLRRAKSAQAAWVSPRAAWGGDYERKQG
jgi:isochorismate hydrolase